MVGWLKRMMGGLLVGVMVFSPMLAGAQPAPSGRAQPAGPTTGAPGKSQTAGPPIGAPGKELVAVLEFDVVGASKAESAAVTDRLQDALLKTGKYTLVDRSQMERILSEQAFQQAGCTTSECAVQAGRVLGVRKIVTGRLTKIDDQTWQLSAQLLDVETAETLKAETLPHRGDYFSLLNELPLTLAERLSGASATTAMAAPPVVPPPPAVPPPAAITPAPVAAAPEAAQPAAQEAPSGPVAGPVLTIVGGVFGGLFGLLAQSSATDAKNASKDNNLSSYNSAKSSYEASAVISDIGYLMGVIGIVVWIAEANTKSTADLPPPSGFDVALNGQAKSGSPYAFKMSYQMSW